MKIPNPFTGKTLYLGKKDVGAAKQRLLYGFYQNAIAGLTGTRVNFDTLYQLYNKLVDVNQAVKKIRNATAKDGFKIVDKNDPNKEGDSQQTEIAMRVLDHPLSGFNDWKNTWVRDRHVAGNYYMLIEKSATGEPIKLTPIDPRTMVVIADKYGVVLKYIQRIMGQDVVEFNPDEIIHSAMDQSTKNPLLGASPIETIVMEGQTELSSQTSNLAFYENHGVPSHLLIVDGELTKDQHKELKTQMEEKFKGSENRFKSGIIPFIKDIKTITPSQKDMQYLETRWFTTKKIVVAFGVDAFILGYTEKVQRGNADVIYRMFYENTIRPQEVEFEEMVNRDLFPKLGLDKIKLKIKLSDYDNKKEAAEISRADVIAGITTINEARAMRGLDEDENELADELLFQGMIIDDVGEEMKEVVQGVQKKLAKRNEKLYNLLDDDLPVL